MIIVIDAYNLLKQYGSDREISSAARTAFIKKAAFYGSHKGHAMVIVFDGGLSSWVERSQVAGVTVIYSGARESADDVIKDYLHEQRGKELLLVSSDSDLVRYARTLSVESIGATAFYALMLNNQNYGAESSRRSAGRAVKMSRRTTPELDALMQGADPQPEKKERDENKQNRKSSGHTLSKEERNIIKKIKKL